MPTTEDIRRCPDGTPVYVEDARQELFLAIRDLPLDQHEARIVKWLYGMDQPTMHAIATLITKAKVEALATYKAGCTVCLEKSDPLDYRSAVDWTVKHAETCEDASTEIWPS